jgi:phage-related protein
MATIATAEVQVIADTSRFVPDLRRKLRQAFSGIGDDLGERIENQISSRLGRRLETLMARLGRNAGTQFSQQFSQSFTNLTRTTATAGERAGRAFTRNFRLEADFEVVMREWLREGVGGTEFSAAGARLARNFGTGFETELNRFSFAPSANPLTIRRSQQFVDNLINTMVARVDNRSQDLVRAFEDGLSDLRNSQRARDFVQDLIDNMVSEAEANAPQVGEALGDGIQQGLLEADTPSAFVTDFLNGIDRRQSQINQRMGRAGAAASAAFFAGIQDAQVPFGGLPGEVLDNFDDIFEELERTTRVRMRTIGNSIRENIGGAADFAGRAVRRLGSAIADIARGVTITPLQNIGQLFSDFTTNLGSAAAMGLVFLGVLDQLTPVLFALPASLALLSAGAVTAVTAFSGMGAAFSAARGSAEEFEDAIEGLAPAAADVAREFRALDDDLDRLRLDAQEALWSELQGAITRVADNIGGPLHAGIVDSAGALGELINGFADFAAEEETAATIAATFDALTGIFQALSDEIQPFLGGLRTLTDEFLPELESIERVIDGIGTEFQEWADAVTQGDLISGLSPAQKAFQSALDTIQQLGRISANVASAVGSIFDAAERNGNGFLDLIERITANVAAAFASPEGQDTLATFLDDLVRIADVVLSVIGTVLEQAPKLAGPIADIVEAIGPDLEDFINNLGDGIATLLEGGGGQVLESIADALGRIDFEQLGEGLSRFLLAIDPILNALDELINFAIDVIDFIGTIAFAVNALGRVQIAGFTDELEEIGTFLSEFGPRVKDGFDDAMEAIGEFFTEFGPRVADGFGDAVEGAVEIGQQIADGFIEIFGPIGEGIASVASAIGTFFTETLPNWGAQAIAFLIQLGIDIFNGLVGIAFDIAEWASGLLTTVTTAFTDIKDAVFLTLQTIGLDVTGSLDGVSSSFTNATSGISDRWNRFWTNVKDTGRNALNTVRDFVSNILSSIRSTISGWIDGVRGRWNSFWNGLSGVVSGALSGARKIVTGALDGIRNAFSNMSDRVRSILSGLRDFISGIFSRIQGIVDNIAGAISNAISAAQNLGNIDLNPFADGGIVHGPTPALVGEAGREVIIPLTRPQRAVELVQQSGLMGLLASQGALGATGGTSGPSPEIHVHSALADPEQIARRAVRILERQATRGLARTGG